MMRVRYTQIIAVVFFSQILLFKPCYSLRTFSVHDKVK